MRHMLARSIAATLLCLGFSTSALAGADTLKEWADNEKLNKKILVLPHMTGNVKKMKEAGLSRPKRVGLVSFYLWDNGSKEFNAMAHAYGGTYERTAGLTPKGANHFATRLAELGIPGLKKAFAAHGMELLEPIDFITTEEQAKTYIDFELPMSGLAKATFSVVDWIERTPRASMAATGFKGIPTHLWQDARMLTALDELRQNMGVDAIAVVANVTTTLQKSVMLNQTNLYLYGPNPVPKPEHPLAARQWSPGVLYANGQFAKGLKEAEIAKMRKGEIQSENYAGFDRIAEVMADEALKTFDEQYEN